MCNVIPGEESGGAFPTFWCAAAGSGVTAGMTPEALLAEAGWLKRLALTLAGDDDDADDADDLVQESWIAAGRRNSDPSRPLRPWLGKVVRDRSRMRRRAETRRTQREAPHPIRTPRSPLTSSSIRSPHRLLVDFVLECDEPYRSALVHRRSATWRGRIWRRPVRGAWTTIGHDELAADSGGGNLDGGRPRCLVCRPASEGERPANSRGNRECNGRHLPASKLV